MLVLTRKHRESVVIGGAEDIERVIKITVLDISGGKVRLGFQVAADIPVHRLEVWERIRATEQADGESVTNMAPKEGSDRWEDDGGLRDSPHGDQAALGAS
jgi:carbon storage regulator